MAVIRLKMTEQSEQNTILHSLVLAVVVFLG